MSLGKSFTKNWTLVAFLSIPDCFDRRTLETQWEEVLKRGLLIARRKLSRGAGVEEKTEGLGREGRTLDQRVSRGESMEENKCWRTPLRGSSQVERLDGIDAWSKSFWRDVGEDPFCGWSFVGEKKDVDRVGRRASSKLRLRKMIRRDHGFRSSNLERPFQVNEKRTGVDPVEQNERRQLLLSWGSQNHFEQSHPILGILLTCIRTDNSPWLNKKSEISKHSKFPTRWSLRLTLNRRLLPPILSRARETHPSLAWRVELKSWAESSWLHRFLFQLLHLIFSDVA